MSRYFAGRWCSNTSGGSTTWSSTLTRIRSSRRSIAADNAADRCTGTFPGPRAAQRVRRGGRPLRRPGHPGHERARCSKRRRSGARSTTPGSRRVTSRDWRARATAGMHEVMLAEYLGIQPKWMESSSVGGSSFEFHTMHAYRAIQNGDVDTVAVVYGNNQLTSFGRTLGTGGGGMRGGRRDAAADGLRIPDRAHARRVVRHGRAASHARVRHDARTAGIDLGADARTRGTKSATPCTATRSPSTTCSRRSSSPTRCTSSTAA